MESREGVVDAADGRRDDADEAVVDADVADDEDPADGRAADAAASSSVDCNGQVVCSDCCQPVGG